MVDRKCLDRLRPGLENVIADKASLGESKLGEDTANLFRCASIKLGPQILGLDLKKAQA